MSAPIYLILSVCDNRIRLERHVAGSEAQACALACRIANVLDRQCIVERIDEAGLSAMCGIVFYDGVIYVSENLMAPATLSEAMNMLAARAAGRVDDD